MTEDSIFKGLYKLCECGCKELIPFLNTRYRIAKFKKGHNTKFRIGENHPRWKGGRKLEGGYNVVKVYNHPKSYQNNIKEHRLIYEQYYRCCLLSFTDIHHIDGNKRNNDINNLLALSHSQHISLRYKEYNKGESNNIR